MLKFGSMFSGIDAPLQALMLQGINHEYTFCNEKNPYALRSLEANYDPRTIYEDVTSVPPSQYPNVDILAAGYPCQDVSNLTQITPYEGKQSKLVIHTLDVVHVKKPYIVLLENVATLTSQRNRPFFEMIKASLYNAKYHVMWFKLNASALGSPQNRNRLWMIASPDKALVDRLRVEFNAPVPLFGEDTSVYDILEPTVDKKYYFSKNSAEKLGKTASPYLKGIVAGMRVKGMFVPRHDKKSTNLDASYYYPIDNNGQRTVIANFKPNGVDIRKFTPRECLRLQEFPETFNIVVPDEEAYRQAGNSMNIRCLRYIYSILFKKGDV